MNTTLNILSEIIEYLQKYQYEKDKEPTNLKDFVIWLNGFIFNRNFDSNSLHNEKDLNLQFTHLLIMQSKYFKMYCKKALKNSIINTPDDFSFLYHLNHYDSFRKMELIHIHLLEAPSGIEVIKRLLKKELIEEFDDPEDKRAKRIRITNRGRKETKKLLPLMKEVYSNMTAELLLAEKLHFISFLKKLNDYHVKNNEPNK